MEEKLRRAEGNILRTKINLEQLDIEVQRMDASGIRDDLNEVTFVIADINSKTNILESGLRNQRTDFDNHIKYAERLKDHIDNTNRKVEKYSFMFENYKILLLESEFIDKDIEVFFAREHNRIRYFVQYRSNGINSYLKFNNFNFGATNIRYYFSNFSFDIDKFKKLNRIIPVYDFDLIMDLNVQKFVIKPLHSDHICGFIFNHITFKISEFTLNDKDNSINQSTLHSYNIVKNTLTSITKRLHLKANREYEFNFIDDISQRVINNKDERYEVGIDFRLRFYYTTDKDINFDSHHGIIFHDK